VPHAAVQRFECGEALRLFQRSLELNGKKAKAHALKADALRALGRLDEAVSAYRVAIERHVDRPDVYVQLGMLLREQDDIEGAAATMEEGLERYPDDVYLLNHLAHIYGFSLGRADRSRAYYIRALEAEKENIHALLGLGILELREGDPSEGLARLARVLEIDPANEPARNAISVHHDR